MIYETLEDVLPMVQGMKANYAKEGVELLGIFGSFARGDEDIYSDIDIAYNLNLQNAYDLHKAYEKSKDEIAKIELSSAA